MIELSQLQHRCAQAVEAAQRHGADSAVARASASSSEGVSVRLGELEDVERSESEEIALRAFVGQRAASIRTSDFSDAALEELAERVVAMAKAAPEDPYSGIADPDQLLQGDAPDLDLADSAEPSPEALRERALEMEDAARAVEGVTNSQGAGATFAQGLTALVTSAGFAKGYRGTAHSLSTSVVAGEGSDMQRDYEHEGARHFEDLPGPAEVGRKAGERAVARLGPEKLASKPVPIVFDPRVGGSLLGHLIGAISGPSIARRASFLLGKEDEQLFDPAIRIIERPHRPRGDRSRPFDGEGLPTADRDLVKDGKITGWLTNLSSARQLGIAPTGHGTGGGVSTGNVSLEPGTVSVAELIADIEDGIYVTELIGMGVNGVTGDYSRGASGLRIRNGEFAGAAAEFTIAGNLIPMFAALRAADDLELKRGMDVPTLRIDGMTVAGD